MDSEPTADRFVAVFDILGFKNLLFRKGLNHAVTLCHQVLSQMPWSTCLPVATLSPGGGGSLSMVQLPFQLASDTILLWSDGPSPHAGQDFFHACGIFVAQAAERGLPLRGAIAYGPTHIDRKNSIYVGEPLVIAFALEKVQAWLGCGVHRTALDAHPQLTKVLFDKADIPSTQCR